MRRSLATGNLPAVCAVLGALNSLLAGTFRRHLEARWKVRMQLTTLLWVRDCSVASV